MFDEHALPLSRCLDDPRVLVHRDTTGAGCAIRAKGGPDFARHPRCGDQSRNAATAGAGEGAGRLGGCRAHGDGGRARVALDDGSLLNVGSSSSLTITQHNAAAQQTQIELEYGRVRSQVVKQSKPNSKFEIHTAVGVAGVVGTDFYLEFLNGMFQIVVYEGTVKFCNLDGACVTVTAGQIATIRDGHQAPEQPTQATPSELTEASVATSVGATGPGVLPVHHISPWWVVGLTVAVAVPAIVVPLATRGSGSKPLPQGCGIGTTNNLC